jgi:hypothetical protein
MTFKVGDLVALRVDDYGGRANYWFRVLGLNNDGTFVGLVERKEWWAKTYGKNHTFTDLKIEDVQGVYEEGQQFCYSDNVTRCSCEGLCKDK